jgi:hypothetical protein
MIDTSSSQPFRVPVPSEDLIRATTTPWLRLTREDSESQRAIARGHAARLPFMLAPELDEMNWPHRRLWDARSALDLGTGLAGGPLLDLCNRMARILVTTDTGFLDDRRYQPDSCPGVIVAGNSWKQRLDEFLVTIVGLLGPVSALYRHVKVHGADGGDLTISAPAGRHRRVTRRFVLDGDGLPLLSELAEAEVPAGAVN